jgi:hypothetical protein
LKDIGLIEYEYYKRNNPKKLNSDKYLSTEEDTKIGEKDSL